MALNDSDGWEGIKFWGMADNRLVISTIGSNPEFNPVNGSIIAVDTPNNGIQLLVQGE